jgi:hypothetical protein
MGKHNSHGLDDGDDPHTITLTHDEVLILVEMFERFWEQKLLKFAHPAEQIALGSLHGQLEKIPWELFDKDYTRLLAEARHRRAVGFEGDVTGLGHVAVKEDGSVVKTQPPKDE